MNSAPPPAIRQQVLWLGGDGWAEMASLGWVPLLLAFVLYASHHGQVHSIFALAAKAPVASVWPKPLDFSSTESTCTSTIWLGRVEPTITIERGNSKAAKAYITKSLKFAKRDWGCSTGNQPPKNPWPLLITVVDARCTTPACYTQHTREGYTLEGRKGSGSLFTSAAAVHALGP